MAAPFEFDPHEELLRRVAEISTLCEELEQAVRSLVNYQRESSDAVHSGRALEASVSGIRRQVLQHYLECRIGEAAQEVGAFQD